MSVSRNYWSDHEVEVLKATMAQGAERGVKPWKSAKLAASQLHRSAESCLLKWRWETEPGFKERGKVKRAASKASTVSESISSPSSALEGCEEIRVTFRELKIDHETKQLVIII